MKYLHTMVRISDIAGEALPPREPWASMPNTGSW